MDRMEKDFYWVPTAYAPEIRNLKQENEHWDRDKYLKREGLDTYNYLYHETFGYKDFDANGSIYEVGKVFIEPDDIVVDVGANVGIFANRAYLLGAKSVYSFEPTLKSFNCLSQNIDPSGIIRPFCMALSDRIKLAAISTDNGNSVGSRLNDHTSDFDLVYTTTIDELFNIKLFDHIDYLKLDVEGEEDKIIYNISRDRLCKINKIVMEYHPWVLTDYEDIIKYLRKNDINHKFTLHCGDGTKIITFMR